MVLSVINLQDKRHLGEQVAEALFEQDVQPLPSSRFNGSGVYALYYMGDFPAYEALIEVKKDDQYLCHIYVGKAVSEGGRKDGQCEDGDPGTALYKRLNDNAEPIEADTNLHISDFRCRFLADDDIWISLAESMVIKYFNPVELLA